MEFKGLPILEALICKQICKESETHYSNDLFLHARHFLIFTTGNTAKNTLLKSPQVQVTAVSGFIEQVGSMIKEIPKHNYHPSTPSYFH